MLPPRVVPLTPTRNVPPPGQFLTASAREGIAGARQVAPLPPRVLRAQSRATAAAENPGASG
eukprot:5141091-Prymnesium_polylepis.1